nr:hypothetical protein [Tanacetum cinerariifolium]
MLDHQDKFMMKAQHTLRGRFLASFQDLEHEGGDTRIVRRYEPFSLSVDLNIKYSKHSLAEDSSTSILQALRRSSSILTSVYVVVKKLNKALARASVQLGWQYSPDDEEDTRSSQEYMNDLEMEFHKRALVAKYKRWDEEEVYFDDSERVEVKVFMELADDESGVASKESAKHGE